MKRLQIGLAVGLLMALPAFAVLELNLSGRVVDAEGKPVVGVDVSLKGTEHKASTDAEGAWSLVYGTPDQPSESILRMLDSHGKSQGSKKYDLQGRSIGLRSATSVYVQRTHGLVALQHAYLAKQAEGDTLLVHFQNQEVGRLGLANLLAGALPDMVLVQMAPTVTPTMAEATSSPFHLLLGQTTNVEFSYDETLWRSSIFTVGEQSIPSNSPHQKIFVVPFMSLEDAQISLALESRTQSIDFEPILFKSFGDPDFIVNAIASSGLDVEITSNTPEVCTVERFTVHLVRAGTCELETVQVGDSLYNASVLVRRFEVQPASQLISFNAPESPVYGESATLQGQSDAHLPVQYASHSESICKVEGETVRFVGVGECVIEATQAGNENYAAAEAVTQTFAVAKAPQTIEFQPMSLVYRGDAVPLLPTVSSSLDLAYENLTPSICTLNGSEVLPVVVGTCQLVAKQAGNEFYLAQETMVTIPVTKMPVSFSINPPTQRLSPKTGAIPFHSYVTVTPSIAGVVSYESTTPDICQINVKTGVLSFVESVAGSGNYNPGPCGIRAYITSNDSTLSAPAQEVYLPTFGVYKDTRDGQDYHTVIRGNELWMAENMRFYVAGSQLSRYENFGRYYTLAAAKDVCPAGWVPFGTFYRKNGRLYRPFWNVLEQSWEGVVDQNSYWNPKPANSVLTNETGFSLWANGYFDEYGYLINYNSNAYLYGGVDIYNGRGYLIMITPPSENNQAMSWSAEYPAPDTKNLYATRCFELPDGVIPE